MQIDHHSSTHTSQSVGNMQIRRPKMVAPQLLQARSGLAGQDTHYGAQRDLQERHSRRSEDENYRLWSLQQR